MNMEDKFDKIVTDLANKFQVKLIPLTSGLAGQRKRFWIRIFSA